MTRGPLFDGSAASAVVLAVDELYCFALDAHSAAGQGTRRATSNVPSASTMNCKKPCFECALILQREWLVTVAVLGAEVEQGAPLNPRSQLRPVLEKESDGEGLRVVAGAWLKWLT